MINSPLNRERGHAILRQRTYLLPQYDLTKFNMLTLLNIFYGHKNLYKCLTHVMCSYSHLVLLRCWSVHNFLWGLFYNLVFFCFLIINYTKLFFVRRLSKKPKKAGRAKIKYKPYFVISNYNLPYFFFRSLIRHHLNSLNIHSIKSKFIFLIVMMLQFRATSWYGRRLRSYTNLQAGNILNLLIK